MMKTLQGVLVLLATPFKANYELAEDALKEQIQWVTEQGADGIIPTGSAGEFTHLTDEELKRVHKICIENVKANMITVAGTGADTTLEAIKRTKYAEDLGYDAVMVIPPYYWKCTEEEVYGHYKALSDASNIQIMVYHNPGLSKFLGTLPFIERLSKIPRVTSMKDSHEDITRTAYLHDKIGVFRTQAYFLFNLMLGGKGGDVATYAVPLCVKIYKAFREGRIKEAAEYQRRLTADWCEWWIGETGEKGVSMLGQWKAANSLVSGIDMGPPRPPYKPASKEKVEAHLKRYGIL